MKVRVVAEAGEDLAQIRGAEHLGSELPVLLGQLLDLAQPHVVDLLRVERQ